MGGGLVVLLFAILAAFVFLGGDGTGGEEAAPPQDPKQETPSSPPPPTGPVGARPVPPEKLPDLAPQSVAVGVFEDQLQVSWSPPRDAASVSGYFVIVQTSDGRVEEQRLVERDADLTVVFDDASLCAVVTTIVGTPAGLQLARGELVCPRPTPTPTAPV
ncbi:hypothetical protein [Streptodolium elevatio]|uniref:Fibronectin type-III domain-containing protein n=1 Tax=Streptodolium elevatio TaxID=3157996 RepID=A0ABV3D9R6_9ACTN